jgi:hypothetical protein
VSESQGEYDILTSDGHAAHRVVAPDEVATHPGPFLLEVKHSHRSGCGRWWRANGAGYTDQLDRAGLYAKDSDYVRNYNTDNRYTLICATVILGPMLRLQAMGKQIVGGAS